MRFIVNLLHSHGDEGHVDVGSRQESGKADEHAEEACDIAYGDHDDP